MTRPTPEAVQTVACVGGGTIGSGWAAAYLAAGKDVVLTDPAPDAERRARSVIDRAWPHLENLGLASGADRARFRFTTTVAEALSDAEFVQESAPEDEALKIKVFAEMDAHARPDTILSSSSSSYLPTHLQSKCSRPERVVIGHPFAPVYLCTLVEVVAGEKTDPEVTAWTAAFYESVGKRSVVLKKEIEGYIANRFQMVLNQEATQLVEAGVCTWEDIDLSVTEGPGLRWPFLGPLTTNHLAGGRGGLAHAIEIWGWGGNDESHAAALASVETRYGDLSMDEMETWRDENLVRLLKARTAPGDD
ncbi:MAG: 3-hydroxyacyl-CoA dehydrogenase NAD-binding domain-containing protein [Alphaproteobacteria bacterium]|jgi:carnitine 3-dehydrogenase|nr:L-carnitine dehydrogenase [Rhodospirillaceae bacterium]MDG2481548.1 3-hydroxyacyl-CoA dehydrogenase NAD-binding domain-containing protein [Alphaproteobacteria bacterium]MBT6202650.1 L-carnitine dehydrogenase [Rhodospirillaceae bacterium]MBT6512586.1 L-carnitine dehydrogenase [Rhodospirillaceae bacterium]MBT7614306.1 L-carnitine dehydrogenase [Rhodospirillaceae bacterium]